MTNLSSAVLAPPLGDKLLPSRPPEDQLDPPPLQLQRRVLKTYTVSNDPPSPSLERKQISFHLPESGLRTHQEEQTPQGN